MPALGGAVFAVLESPAGAGAGAGIAAAAARDTPVPAPTAPALLAEPMHSRGLWHLAAFIGIKGNISKGNRVHFTLSLAFP